MYSLIYNYLINHINYNLCSHIIIYFYFIQCKIQITDNVVERKEERTRREGKKKALRLLNKS